MEGTLAKSGDKWLPGIEVLFGVHCLEGEVVKSMLGTGYFDFVPAQLFNLGEMNLGSMKEVW